MSSMRPEIKLLESRLADLFFELPVPLKGTYRTFQVMLDDNFNHRRDRTSNDVHIFFELHEGGYFHLRSYTRHMAQNLAFAKDRVFLTGYRKLEVTLNDGEHSLRQDWYSWEAISLAKEISMQNPDIFPPYKQVRR
jgi:hypothetical protein